MIICICMLARMIFISWKSCIQQYLSQSCMVNEDIQKVHAWNHTLSSGTWLQLSGKVLVQVFIEISHSIIVSRVSWLQFLPTIVLHVYCSPWVFDYWACIIITGNACWMHVMQQLDKRSVHGVVVTSKPFGVRWFLSVIINKGIAEQ